MHKHALCVCVCVCASHCGEVHGVDLCCLHGPCLASMFIRTHFAAYLRHGIGLEAGCCKAFGPIILNPGLWGLPMAGSSRGSSTSTLDDDGDCPVITAWKNLPGVMHRVAKYGRICYMQKKGVDRQCVIDNAAVIEPILAAFGASSLNSFCICKGVGGL